MIVASRPTVSIRNGWYGRALPIQRKRKRIAASEGDELLQAKARFFTAKHRKSVVSFYAVTQYAPFD